MRSSGFTLKILSDMTREESRAGSAKCLNMSAGVDLWETLAKSGYSMDFLIFCNDIANAKQKISSRMLETDIMKVRVVNQEESILNYLKDAQL